MYVCISYEIEDEQTLCPVKFGMRRAGEDCKKGCAMKLLLFAL